MRLLLALLAQFSPLGWTLTCGDKPSVVVWVDAPATNPPLPVTAWVFWSPTPDPSQGTWARAESGGKVGLYVAIPLGSYVWPAWEIAGVQTFQYHPAFCP